MSNEPQALQLADFMDIFSGNIHNYGVHNYNFTNSGKENGTNATVTNKLLTIEQYKAHLSGQQGLGVIPIDAKGEARFGVIDIDVYDEDLDFCVKAIEYNNLPLVPFKSKSGGLHIYLFLKQPVAAKTLVDYLKAITTMLGLDLYVKHKLNRIIEIFPKQVKTTAAGAGSWLNMPYYNITSTRQYAIYNGKPMSFDSALAYIKEKRCTITDLKALLSELPYRDGPPCLQTINLLNVMDQADGRNNYLFSFGVYLKQAKPEFWEQHLFELNERLATPLPTAELEATIINSLRKKDYTYKCNEQPCVDFCRKAMCKTRDYGIGKEGGYFSELDYGRLIQVNSYEPYYEWEVKALGEEKFKLLRFKNEQDIIGQDAFLRLCFRELHMLPIKLKQSAWFSLVNQALVGMTIIAVDHDDDTTPIGLFRSLFTEFLIDRAMAQTKEQILNKRVYFDKNTSTFYFRTIDLSDFIFILKGFKYYTPGELHGLLRDFKAVPTRIKTEQGKQLRVYSLTESNLHDASLRSTAPFEAEFKSVNEEF